MSPSVSANWPLPEQLAEHLEALSVFARQALSEHFSASPKIVLDVFDNFRAVREAALAADWKTSGT